MAPNCRGVHWSAMAVGIRARGTAARVDPGVSAAIPALRAELDQAVAGQGHGVDGDDPSSSHGSRIRPRDPWPRTPSQRSWEATGRRLSGLGSVFLLAGRCNPPAPDGQALLRRLMETVRSTPPALDRTWLGHRPWLERIWIQCVILTMKPCSSRLRQAPSQAGALDPRLVSSSRVLIAGIRLDLGVEPSGRMACPAKSCVHGLKASAGAGARAAL